MDSNKVKIKTCGNKTIPKSDQTLSCARDPASAPMFVPRTPQGALIGELKKLEDNLNKSGLRRVKLVEEGGLTIADMLVKATPFKTLLCSRGDCQICLIKGSKGQCSVRSITYSNTCLKC